MTKANLKPGDILNRVGRHVRIFNVHRGAQANIFESGGGGYRRAYRNGDTRGRVINRNIAWDDNYTPYSPFPQLESFDPPAGSYPLADLIQPTITARFYGSGDLIVKEFSVDATCGAFRTTATSPLEVSHTPAFNLSLGRHIVLLRVINRIVGKDFEDTFTLEFDLY